MRPSYETREEMARKFATETGPAIIRELAKLEPDAGWKPKYWVDRDIPTDRRLQGATNDWGEDLHIGFDPWEARVSCSGNYGETIDGKVWVPRDYMRGDDKTEDPHITMSVDRDPAALAKDIVRRVLPNYRVILAYKRKRFEESVQREANGRKLYEELLQLGSGLLSPMQRERTPGGDYTISFMHHEQTGKGVQYGDVRLSENWVRIEMSLTPEGARKVIAALAK